jgi:hypothetical protein
LADAQLFGHRSGGGPPGIRELQATGPRTRCVETINKGTPSQGGVPSRGAAPKSDHLPDTSPCGTLRATQKQARRCPNC